MAVENGKTHQSEGSEKLSCTPRSHRNLHLPQLQSNTTAPLEVTAVNSPLDTATAKYHCTPKSHRSPLPT